MDGVRVPQVVDHTARSSDNDVRASSKFHLLRLHRQPPYNNAGADVGEFAHLDSLVVDLSSQLACRGENKHARHSHLGRPVQQTLHDGQYESTCLARPCDGVDKQVVTAQAKRDGFSLHRSCICPAQISDSAHQRPGELKLRKLYSPFIFVVCDGNCFDGGVFLLRLWLRLLLFFVATALLIVVAIVIIRFLIVSFIVGVTAVLFLAIDVAFFVVFAVRILVIFTVGQGRQPRHLSALHPFPDFASQR
mmetsp:Transcript_10472/g.19817  ORF Transcript_10472/g.19817 Transcript_10472/m.19817 type:complete len:248 (-) Transcript_10472:201-944(-)